MHCFIRMYALFYTNVFKIPQKSIKKCNFNSTAVITFSRLYLPYYNELVSGLYAFFNVKLL